MTDALEEARVWARVGEEHAAEHGDEAAEAVLAFSAAGTYALIAIAESLERINQKT